MYVTSKFMLTVKTCLITWKVGWFLERITVFVIIKVIYVVCLKGKRYFVYVILKYWRRVFSNIYKAACAVHL